MKLIANAARAQPLSALFVPSQSVQKCRSLTASLCPMGWRGEACGAKTRQSAETLPFSPCALFQPLCRVAAPLMIWDKFCPMEQSARTGCGCDKRRAPIVFFICAAPNKAANTCTLFSIRGVSLEDSLKMESLSLFGNLVLFSSAFHRTTFAVVPQEKNYKRHF